MASSVKLEKLESNITAGFARGRKVQSAQVMRGLAALAVVFFHTHVILVQPEYGGLDVLGQAASRGWLGVNFFFVLSGFIILFAHAKDLGRPDSLSRYFWRRFVRVYPIYWIFLTAYIAAAAFGFGYPDFKWQAGHLFTAYSLFAVVDMPTLPLKVAWTLLFEVKFYVIFAVMLISVRAGFVTMLLWAAAILVRNAFPPPPDWGYIAPDWGLLNIWNINFMFGMLACWSLGWLAERFGPWLFAAGISLLVLLGWEMQGSMGASDQKPILMFFLALSFSLIFVGAVLCERHYNWTPPKWTMLIGDASYSIYLIHSAVLSQVAHLNYKFAFGKLPPTVVFLVAFATAVAGGVVAHLTIERPLLNRLRGFRARGEKPAHAENRSG